MGKNYVGIGTDFDCVQPEAFMAIPHPGKMNELWENLDKAGVNSKVMSKIAHENFLQIINNPQHEEHQEMLDWVGGKFDTEKFNPQEVTFDNPKKGRQLAFKS